MWAMSSGGQVMKRFIKGEERRRPSLYYLALKRFGLVLLLSLLGLLFIISSHSESAYTKIPIPERKMNLTGLQMITTQYLDEHPGDFQKFIRILTEADDALQENSTFTRGNVMRWLRRAMKREQIDEKAPVYLFLKNVYLQDWEGSYLSQVDDEEREYIYDLIGATIGGMYHCTCAPPELRTG
jgi:hypothetical protein